MIMELPTIWDETMESSEEDLTPRAYQSQVLDTALVQNTIVFLPTGSGKTFIAVMLIKRLSAALQEKFTDGGKRTFFLVNTVALAEQQKNYIQRHACLSVGHYTGDMNIDYWKEEKWKEELNKNQVLVMTAQILLDLLNHNYLRLSSINLLVFDECHHAVNHHCMSKIMKHFEYYPEEEQPRVLGLTATLLNSSVKCHRVRETVKILEDTFKSKIATIENVNEVHSFSTNPDEKHIVFEDPEKYRVLEEVKLHIDRLSEFLVNYIFEEDRTTAPIIDGAVLQKGKTMGKKLSNMLYDVWLHIESLGLYGGSLSALKLIMIIERLRAKAELPDTMMIYATMITTLSMIRKLLEDEMKGYCEETKIYKFSSPQVLSLLEVLNEYHCEDGRGIVFVQRRLTAKVLFNILRAASEHTDKLKFVSADFVVGFQNNPMNNTREGQLEKKWNKQAIEKFHKGETNTVVASDVLEEGIDIPQCNFVVKFDAPKTYRSYIQSKGRARHKNSNFVVLIAKKEEHKLSVELKDYQDIENVLRKILCGSQQPSSMELEITEVPLEELIYRAAEGARVTYNSAIPLVNRYCSILPQDTYTKLVQYWFLVEDPMPPYQCILQLPINSPLKEGFKGRKMPNKKLAKQAAAFAACVALHKAGELNNHLLPVGHKSDKFIDKEEIFSVYRKASENEKMEQPGTKKCRRIYRKQVAKSLSGCAPTEHVPLYMHVIHMTPTYEEPPEDNTRKHAFYELLQTNKYFAILSSKRLPELCDFPVFLNVGRIAVHLLLNSSVLFLQSHEITSLKQFHTMLFFDLLKLNKSYVLADPETEGNNFLVVPVMKQESEQLNTYVIDWNVIKNNCHLPAFKQPSEAERLGKDCMWSKFQHSLVVPWYRGFPPEQVYVVTQVCEDLSPLSSFPTSAFPTFEDYFLGKYSLNIKHSSQPLFEVKAITSRLNCLKPRSGNVSGRSKRKELNDDFEEHLVPELCIPIDFPSSLWIKAVCLPSCLHRISHLLLAEELSKKIAEDLKLQPHTGENQKSFPIDRICVSEDEDRPKRSVSHSGTKGNAALLNARASLWGGEGEPVDIDRLKVEDVTLMDILYYDEFINKPAVPNVDCSLDDSIVMNIVIPKPEEIITPTITLLQDNHGIPISKILQALTCACSNDALNLERLETLGDSFLKYASSLFLFLQYPKLDEGKLTQVKGKIVGNRNLFYCGRNKDLVGKMKVHEFNPKADWIPPRFCIPKEIIQSLLDYELCPSILFEISFPREEQESGVLSSVSQNLWQEVINSADRKYTPSPTESLIGIQSVPDKMVADCVEALIGAYLQGYGIEGALKLVGWLGILPPDLADPSYLLGTSNCTPYICHENNLEEKLNFLLLDSEVVKLEKLINYNFKDRGYLLQALSHASFNQNRLTDCYQRLEFLGDALLDFLVTCHIYEHCEELSPGDLTDLRSALVNNITFGSLAVRYGFHQFCRYDSPKLFDKIDAFVNFQEKHGHRINEDVLLLLDEVPGCIGESVDVPKVLGDLFESVAGAIFLDSGKSLSTVWNVYYRLMKNEIDLFSQDIPKQPVRILYELCNPPPVFSISCPLEDTQKIMVELEVIVKGEKLQFYGVGENKADAKRTAAKLALRHMKNAGLL